MGAMSVPRILHHIWLGPREVPDEWARVWREMHPDWEYRLWRHEDIRALPLRCRKQYNDRVAAECWHGAADIARLEILRVHGGVYVDIDSKPLRSLDGAPFMEAAMFAAYEPVASLPGRVANGTIGAVPGADAIETALSLLQKMTVLEPPWDTTGGSLLTAAMLVHHRCCDTRTLPARTFYATSANGRPVPGKETSYSQHFWSSTNATYTPRVVVLVPRRGDGGPRDRAWAYVEEWWRSHGFDVYVGEDEGPERFNAAAARNRAARAAGTWDVGIFADADTIPGDAEDIRRAVDVAHERKRFVRPYKQYIQLTEEATDRWLSEGPHEKGQRPLPANVPEGGLAIVPRTLFDEVGGYDERFVGWGWEDTAFAHACRVMGGFVQTDGKVLHFWHPISSDRNTSDPQFLANRALGNRYTKARNRKSLRLVLSERAVPRGTGVPTRLRIGIVVTANGRRHHLAEMMASVERNITPAPDATLICDDSGDPRTGAWLRANFPAATVDAHPHMGHGPAIARAWNAARSLDVDYILWMEEDMVWQGRVDLTDVAAVIATAGIEQMAFLRNSHFPAEVEAGPHQLSRFDPALFVPEATMGHQWLRHREFYTLNPNLAPLSTLLRNRWPPAPNSEHRFSRHMFRHGDKSVGMWGRLDDDPIVLHAGVGERTGDGY